MTRPAWMDPRVTQPPKMSSALEDADPATINLIVEGTLDTPVVYAEQNWPARRSDFKRSASMGYAIHGWRILSWQFGDLRAGWFMRRIHERGPEAGGRFQLLGAVIAAVQLADASDQASWVGSSDTVWANGVLSAERPGGNRVRDPVLVAAETALGVPYPGAEEAAAEEATWFREEIDP